MILNAGPSSVCILYRSAIKVFYSTRAEAEKDGYSYSSPAVPAPKCSTSNDTAAGSTGSVSNSVSPAGRNSAKNSSFVGKSKSSGSGLSSIVSKVTGQIHPFGGLRGDAKQLWREVKNGTEQRVRLLQIKQDIPLDCSEKTQSKNPSHSATSGSSSGSSSGSREATRGSSNTQHQSNLHHHQQQQSLVDRLFDDAVVIIWACGYSSEMVPVLDVDGETPIPLRTSGGGGGGAGQVEVDDMARVLAADCAAGDYLDYSCVAPGPNCSSAGCVGGNRQAVYKSSPQGKRCARSVSKPHVVNFPPFSPKAGIRCGSGKAEAISICDGIGLGTAYEEPLGDKDSATLTAPPGSTVPADPSSTVGMLGHESVSLLSDSLDLELAVNKRTTCSLQTDAVPVPESISSYGTLSLTATPCVECTPPDIPSVVTATSTPKSPAATPATLVRSAPSIIPGRTDSAKKLLSTGFTPAVGPIPVKNLLGTGLGFGLRVLLENGQPDGSSGRADGVAVYLKRAATLVLAQVLGEKVFGGYGLRSWEERSRLLKKMTGGGIDKDTGAEPALLSPGAALSFSAAAIGQPAQQPSPFHSSAQRAIWEFNAHNQTRRPSTVASSFTSSRASMLGRRGSRSFAPGADAPGADAPGADVWRRMGPVMPLQEPEQKQHHEFPRAAQNRRAMTPMRRLSSGNNPPPQGFSVGSMSSPIEARRSKSSSRRPVQQAPTVLGFSATAGHEVSSRIAAQNHDNDIGDRLTSDQLANARAFIRPDKIPDSASGTVLSSTTVNSEQETVVLHPQMILASATLCSSPRSSIDLKAKCGTSHSPLHTSAPPRYITASHTDPGSYCHQSRQPSLQRPNVVHPASSISSQHKCRLQPPTFRERIVSRLKEGKGTICTEAPTVEPSAASTICTTTTTPSQARTPMAPVALQKGAKQTVKTKTSAARGSVSDIRATHRSTNSLSASGALLGKPSPSPSPSPSPRPSQLAGMSCSILRDKSRSLRSRSSSRGCCVHPHPNSPGAAADGLSTETRRRLQPDISADGLSTETR